MSVSKKVCEVLSKIFGKSVSKGPSPSLFFVITYEEGEDHRGSFKAYLPAAHAASLVCRSRMIYLRFPIVSTLDPEGVCVIEGAFSARAYSSGIAKVWRIVATGPERKDCWVRVKVEISDREAWLRFMDTARLTYAQMRQRAA